MICLCYFTLRPNSCPQSWCSATPHLIKYQIWTWPFVGLHVCAQSAQTDAEQKPAAYFFVRLQQRLHRPTGHRGGNFRVKVRTTYFLIEKTAQGTLSKNLEGYICHRSRGRVERGERASNENHENILIKQELRSELASSLFLQSPD